MKRLFSCCLLALCLCCGCGSSEKPEPIHLDEQGGALGLLLPGQNQSAVVTKAPQSDSQVLGNLLGQNEDVPVVEGFETQTLQDQYTALRDEVALALEDETADRETLRTKIRQMSGVVSLQAAQVKSANLNAADEERLEAFYQRLSRDLNALLDDLKK